jgi:ABC-2 type transport system permease protein
MSTWRRLRSITRYKLNFAMDLVIGIVMAAGLLIFQYIVNPASLQSAVGSANYFSFLLIGVAFQAYYGIALWGSPGELQNELTTGQIEYTFASPVSRYAYMLSYVFSDAIVATLFQIGPMVVIGAVFSGVSLSLTDISWSLTVLALTFLAFCQLGVLFSCALLLFKNVSALSTLMNFLFQFGTGMFVPLQYLPGALQVLSFVIPLTHGIDLTRHFLMGTKTVWPVEIELGALIFFLVSLGLLAKLTVAYVERKAKKEGLSMA